MDAADLPLPSLDNLALQTPLLLREKWLDEEVADEIAAEPDRIEDGDIVTTGKDSADIDLHDQHGNKRDHSIDGSMSSDLVMHKNKKQK